MKKLRENQKGFTIIEVLIVLAIAGLIMVIVFLAVPALQRNSRNTQRQADAAKIAGAISQCMANRNGVVTNCDTTAELGSSGGLELNRLQQITSVDPSGTPATFEKATFLFNNICLPGGDAPTTTGATTRGAAVLFLNENGQAAANGIRRCIDV